MHRPVSDLLRKGGVLVFTSPHASVAEAVERMAFHNIGSILILDESYQVIGIFTERDLLRRVVVKSLEPAKTQISDVMTPDVISISSDTSGAEVRMIMREKHIRHIPVYSNDKLLGVISLRDVLRYENEEKDFEINQLKSYMMENPYPKYPG